MNVLMIAAENARKRFGRKVAGQVFWDVPGTYEWVVPAGVTKVSLAMVGSGGNSNGSAIPGNRGSGKGGNLRYINDIAVVPGQTYNIVVATPGSQLSSGLGYDSTAAIGGVVAGANGISGINGGDWANGGDAGGGQSGRNGFGFDLRTFTIANRPQGYPTLRGAPGGGGAGYNINASPASATGGDGAVRIIWGTDRAFPTTNIIDV